MTPDNTTYKSGSSMSEQCPVRREVYDNYFSDYFYKLVLELAIRSMKANTDGNIYNRMT